jgi:uncharacterized protein (DUF342 family)
MTKAEINAEIRQVKESIKVRNDQLRLAVLSRSKYRIEKLEREVNPLYDRLAELKKMKGEAQANRRAAEALGEEGGQQP